MVSKRGLLLASVAAFAPAVALAQSAPTFSTRQTPSASQWQSYFASKLDVSSVVGRITPPLATGVAATDTANVQAALDAVPAAGAIVFIPGAGYIVNRTLLIHSNTHLVFARGASFQMTALGSFTGTTVGGVTANYLLQNVNYAAGSITDHDIIIEDAQFDMSVSGVGGSGVLIRRAKNVHVLRPNCPSGGGNCTAMLADDTTVVVDGTAIGMSNACWDHWEGTVRPTVRGGNCTTAGAAGGTGVFMTGTDTAQTSAGVVFEGVIEGGSYTIGATQGACVWLGGLGAAGSGVSKIRVGYINCATTSPASNAIKISGGGSDVQIISPTISGTVANGAAIYETADSGGTPSRTTVQGGIIDGFTSSPANPLIQMDGTSSRVSNVTAFGGTYTSAIRLNGTNQFAAHNTMPAGSAGVYSLTGTGWSVVEPDLPISWSPTFNFGTAHAGMTFSTPPTGQYYLNGKRIKACGQLTLTAKGSSTGSATVDTLPFPASILAPTLDIQYGGIASITAQGMGLVFPGGSSMFFYTGNNNNAVATDANFSNGSSMNFCLDYPISP